MILRSLYFAPEIILATGVLLLLLIKPICTRDSRIAAVFVGVFYLVSLLTTIYLWSFLPHSDAGRLFASDSVGFFVKVSVLVLGLAVLRMVVAWRRRRHRLRPRVIG